MPMGQQCRQSDYGSFVGRRADAATAAELQRASGARVIRWVQPGMAVTMDYREDRLTVRLDSGNRIVAANCG
jgi:hypothetical protein